MTPQLKASIDRAIAKAERTMTLARERDADRLLYDAMAQGSTFDTAATMAADFRIHAEATQQIALAKLRAVLPQLLAEVR